jgi:hypothetical protein
LIEGSLCRKKSALITSKYLKKKMAKVSKKQSGNAKVDAENKLYTVEEAMGSLKK